MIISTISWKILKEKYLWQLKDSAKYQFYSIYYLFYLNIYSILLYRVRYFWYEMALDSIPISIFYYLLFLCILSCKSKTNEEFLTKFLWDFTSHCEISISKKIKIFLTLFRIRYTYKIKTYACISYTYITYISMLVLYILKLIIIK